MSSEDIIVISPGDIDGVLAGDLVAKKWCHYHKKSDIVASLQMLKFVTASPPPMAIALPAHG
jgi:hypothetical protein